MGENGKKEKFKETLHKNLIHEEQQMVFNISAKNLLRGFLSEFDDEGKRVLRNMFLNGFFCQPFDGQHVAPFIEFLEQDDSIAFY